MKDLSKLLATLLFIGIIAAYWDGIKSWLVDVEAGIVRLASLLDMEPTTVIVLGGIILFILYANR